MFILNNSGPSIKTRGTTKIMTGNPVAVTKSSDIAPISSKEFLDI